MLPSGSVAPLLGKTALKNHALESEIERVKKENEWLVNEITILKLENERLRSMPTQQPMRELIFESAAGLPDKEWKEYCESRGKSPDNWRDSWRV